MKYFERRRKAKLYRQWAERDGLPPEAIPTKNDKSKDVPVQIDNHEAVSHEAVSHEAVRPEANSRVKVQPGSPAVTHAEVGGDMMAEIDKRQPRLRILYMLFGVSSVILIVGLILLITNSC